MEKNATHIASARPIPDAWNRVTERIIRAAIEVHANLGPGLLENLYERAFAYELDRAGLRCERQRPIALQYKGMLLGEMRLDLVVENLVIVELKAIERTLPVHGAQLLSYLHSANLPIGLLINFHTPKLVDGVTRKLNSRCSLLQSLPSVPLVSSPISDPSAFAFPEDHE